MTKLPVVEKDLLDYLEGAFPDTCPNYKDSDREIWMAVGAVSVVRNLRTIYEEQQNNILNR